MWYPSFSFWARTEQLILNGALQRAICGKDAFGGFTLKDLCCESENGVAFFFLFFLADLHCFVDFMSLLIAIPWYYSFINFKCFPVCFSYNHNIWIQCQWLYSSIRWKTFAIFRSSNIVKAFLYDHRSFRMLLKPFWKSWYIQYHYISLQLSQYFQWRKFSRWKTSIKRKEMRSVKSRKRMKRWETNMWKERGWIGGGGRKHVERRVNWRNADGIINLCSLMILCDVYVYECVYLLICIHLFLI